MKKNLVLTGMMGVGKSTIGKKLAKRLKLQFADIDKIIEDKEKRSIKEIFELKGESYFRKIEKKITLEILKKHGFVIALGGGAILNSSVRKEVNNSSLSFWLDLNLKTLVSRLKNVQKRPLLSELNLEKTVNKIYLERKKIYSESDFKIKCNDLDINEITKKIINLYENSTN